MASIALTLATVAAACAAPTGDGVPVTELESASTLSSAKLSFSGWTEVGGNGTAVLADTATSYAGKLYLFGIGIGDHAHYVNSFDGLKWSGWSLLPGGSTTLVSDSAVTYNGKLYLFGIGPTDHAHYFTTFDGTSWSGWSPVPGGGTTILSDGAAVYDGKLYVFAIGTNDHAHYFKTFDGATWSAWSTIPGGGTTVTSDAAVSYNGKLYVFGLGIGDHGQYVNAFDGQSWSGWAAVPGGLASLVPDAAVSFGGKLYLYAINKNDGTHSLNMFDGTSWAGWSALSGGGGASVADAVAVHHDKIYQFTIGSDQHHYVQVASDHAAVLPAYNEVAWTGTHNSYWVKRDNVVELEASGTQERIVDQALFEGVRGMEIDIHRDDTTPHNFTVYHTDKPSNSFCPQLSDCFKELLDFHHALPDHDPFTIVLELKEISEQFFDSSSHTPADLDAIIEQYLGPYLFRPRDLMATCPGVGQARNCAAHGWPTVDQLRGKFLVTVIGNYNGEAGDVANDCVPVLAHNRKAWVDYGASALQRSAFLMESPWATGLIACQEGIPQAAVDAVVANAPFVQYEGDVNGLTSAQMKGWLQGKLVVRADIFQNNQPQLQDQAAGVAAGMTILQNDYPWWTNAQTPLRPGQVTGRATLSDVTALNEPGHRILMKRLQSGGTRALAARLAGRPSTHWETTVSDTRPTTSSDSPNRANARGTGCLYASTPTDSNGNFQNGVRICRTTASGAWNVSKPLGEDVTVTIDVVQNGSTSTTTLYSDDRDAGGNGELLRLDVAQTSATSSCVTVSSSEQTLHDVPVWRGLKTQCFATPLTEQGLAARDGDVLFVGTKLARSYGTSAPLVATEDFEVVDSTNGVYAVSNLTWPR